MEKLRREDMNADELKKDSEAFEKRTSGTAVPEMKQQTELTLGQARTAVRFSLNNFDLGAVQRSAAAAIDALQEARKTDPANAEFQRLISMSQSSFELGWDQALKASTR